MSGNGAGRADARATKKQVETLERKQLALKLVELGARTNIVTSSTGVSDAFARTLFREVHQRSPSQGLATQPAGLLNSPARREAAAAFAAILGYYDLLRRGADASIVELVGDFVEAFHLFQNVVSSGELDVNNAFYLWRYLVSGQLAMPKCRVAGPSLLSYPTYPRRTAGVARIR